MNEKYILVEIGKDKWVVARPGAVEGEYRRVTKPACRSLAERAYDDLRILGINKVSLTTEALLV